MWGTEMGRKEGGFKGVMEKWVLRMRRKVSEDGQVQTSAGSEFQTVDAATLKTTHGRQRLCELKEQGRV